MKPAPARRLLCVYQHAPTPEAPGIYRHRLYLSELVRRGWTVDMVSSPVNYMTGNIPERYRRRPFSTETIDGVMHHWVWASRGIHESRRRRAANYLTFASSAGLRALLLPRPDVVLVSSPPLTVGALGPLLGLRSTGRWLLEVRDAWPESAVSVGWLSERSQIYRILDRLARGLTSRAAAVIVPTPGLVDIVRGHGAQEVRVVPGSVFDAEPDPADRARTRSALGLDPGTCLFLYVGAVGAANGLDLLLDAVKRLPAAAEAALVVVGDGSARSELELRCAREGIDRVRFLGAVPKPAIAGFLAASDVCLHLLRPDPVFHTAQPTKVLEYFGAHRPFITTVRGVPERLARESGGGFAPTSDALAVELARWIEMSPKERAERGERSFAYGVSEFPFAAAVDELESALADAAETRPIKAPPTTRTPRRGGFR